MVLNPTDFIGSLAKGLSVIEAFSLEKPRLSISDVAAATGLDRATARRCLLTISELGYAEYDGKYFRLAPRILRLGAVMIATMPLPSLVQPWLDKLSTEIGQSTSVSILDDWEIVYLARATQQKLMSINLMPGSRLPASCASMGRVLLSGLTDAQIKNVLKKHPLIKRTDYSITEVDKFMRAIQLIRSQGFAIVDQEIELGLRSIAVPLYDVHGKLVAALNVGVAATHDNAQELRELYLTKILEVQRAIKPLLV